VIDDTHDVDCGGSVQGRKRYKRYPIVKLMYCIYADE
jgi:hypothetical protein